LKKIIAQPLALATDRAGIENTVIGFILDDINHLYDPNVQKNLKHWPTYLAHLVAEFKRYMCHTFVIEGDEFKTFLESRTKDDGYERIGIKPQDLQDLQAIWTKRGQHEVSEFLAIWQTYEETAHGLNVGDFESNIRKHRYLSPGKFQIWLDQTRRFLLEIIPAYQAVCRDKKANLNSAVLRVLKKQGQPKGRAELPNLKEIMGALGNKFEKMYAGMCQLYDLPLTLHSRAHLLALEARSFDEKIRARFGFNGNAQDIKQYPKAVFQRCDRI